MNEAPRNAEDITRSLPHAVGPEKSILSTMLQDPEEFIDMAIEEGLSEAHFYLPNHMALYGFLLGLREDNVEIELVSLVQRLLDAGMLERVGGPGYLTELYTYSPSPGHFRSHLRHVKDKFLLRCIVRASNEAVAAVYEEPEDPALLLDDVERNFMAIRDGGSGSKTEGLGDDIKAFLLDFQRRVEGKDKAKGLASGFEELDRMTGGLKPGEMYVLAARPSMGKTSLMMNIVEHVCVDNLNPTLVFSCEMSRYSLVERLGYARAKFSVSQFSRGYVAKKQELQRVQTAAMQIRDAPLYIEDRSGPTINEIRAKARRMKRKHGIKLVAVDYLQLCRSTSKQANGSREREIAEISAGLKGMAKDLEIPVIVLAQINRDADKRTGKAKGRPKMSDLRESGAIEQDADLIGLLFRSAQYAEDEEEKAALVGKAELIIAKNRHGATGSIPLTFIDELMRFESGPPVTEEEPFMPKPKARKGWD